MSENRYWAAFGLTEPKADGAQEPGTDAAPAVQTASEGAQEPGTNADPGNTEQTTVSAPAADTAGTDENTQPAGTEQTPKPAPAPEAPKTGLTEQQRHENAERRRAEERRAQEETLRKEITEQVLKDLGLKNHFRDGKPVTTPEEYREYHDDAVKARLQREAKNGTLTPETLQEAVLASPAIRQAVEDANRRTEEATTAAQQAAAAEASAQRAQYQADMERQIAEIKKINPQIKSIDDIIKMESGPTFAGYIRKGLTPVEAYQLANHDAIISNARGAAEQAARNAAAGKSHLQTTPSGNGNGISVSAETRERYRRFNPNITDAEIASMEKRLGE